MSDENQQKDLKDVKLDEESPEQELNPTKVNVEKASAEELRKVHLTSKNNLSITKKILSGETQVELKIPSSEKEKHAVFVSINGVPYNIPRDRYVTVPMSVVKTLEESIFKEYRLVKDENSPGGQKLVMHERMRFAFVRK